MTSALPQTSREVAQNYIKFQATSIIKEIVARYYGRYSWQLEVCLKKYEAEYSLPHLPSATVRNFCAKLDSAYPLSTKDLLQQIAGQKLTEHEYNSTLRRLAEKKRLGIDLHLCALQVIYQPQEFKLCAERNGEQK